MNNEKALQKQYQNELNSFRNSEKPKIKERVKEVKAWMSKQDKKDKKVKSTYKSKMLAAKSPNFDFTGNIKLENISYVYSKNTPFEFNALTNTTVDFEVGKITAIIGTTGSGKSTLIQMTNGLLISDTGRVRVGTYQIPASTKKIPEVKNLRREIGLVFQFPEYQLFEETIEKDISFGPINLGGDKFESIAKVPEYLRMVDLPEDYAKRSPFDLSGGQKRRVAIAGIIAMDGNTLVLDEPTGGLDPRGEEDFMALFQRLNKEKGKRIIIVTHNMDHVLQIADQVVVMKEGQLFIKDTPRNVFKNKEMIEELGIEPPKLYNLAYKLKEKGIDVLDKEFRTVEDLAKVIKEAKKK